MHSAYFWRFRILVQYISSPHTWIKPLQGLACTHIRGVFVSNLDSKIYRRAIHRRQRQRKEDLLFWISWGYHFKTTSIYLACPNWLRKHVAHWTPHHLCKMSDVQNFVFCLVIAKKGFNVIQELTAVARPISEHKFTQLWRMWRRGVMVQTSEDKILRCHGCRNWERWGLNLRL